MGIAETAAQFVENPARALNVDFVRHLNALPEIGPLIALKAAKRIAALIARRLALLGQLLHKLLHKPLRALPQPLKRLGLIGDGFSRITAPEIPFSILHGLPGLAERLTGVETELLQLLQERLERFAHTLLPLPKLVELILITTLPLLALSELLLVLSARSLPVQFECLIH